MTPSDDASVRRATGQPSVLTAAGFCPVRWSILLGVIFAAGAAIDAFCIPSSRGKTLFADAWLVIAGLIACGWLALGAQRQRSRSSQTAWRWICAGVGSWTLGQTTWLILEVVFKMEPFPSLADCFFLFYYPLLFRGVFKLPFTTSEPGEFKKLLVDTGLALLAGLLLFGNLIVAPLFGQHGTSAGFITTVLALAYPATDLALLWPLCVLLLARRPAADQCPARLLAAAMITMMTADCLFAYQSLIGTFASGEVTDGIYCLALIIAGIAGACRAEAVEPEPALSPEAQAEAARPSWRWPAIQATVCLVLLAIAWTGPVHSPTQVRCLMLGSLAFVSLLVFRQILSLRENRALLDALHQAGEELRERGAALAVANAQLQEELDQRRRLEEERFRMMQKMQQTQRLESLGVLAGGIAHDFNNLLTVIIGNVGLARLCLDRGHAAVESLDEAEQAIRRAADLTQQMLAYSGNGRFSVAPVNVNELVREMGALLASSIAKTSTLHYEMAEDTAVIEADATQIRQVVMNLIINAGEAAAPEGGNIYLRTGFFQPDAAFLAECVAAEPLPPGDYVYIEVQDDGSGMPPEVAAKIFDPFFTTKFTGRGLGLSATLGIIRSHGGAIRVSSAPGKGSTFTVALPACAQAPASKADADEPARGAGTILIVDDEAAVRVVVTQLLEQSGYRTLQAANGQEAVALIQERPNAVDAVLLDLTMPVMGGEETLRRLRQLRANLPVIMASGFCKADVSRRFAAETPDGFVQKPFTIGNLTSALDSALN